LTTTPEYRLRLFLSVDLVGSTAYKADSDSQKFHKVKPKWVSVFSYFYRDFPDRLKTSFQSGDHLGITDQEKNFPPKLWKTIGDEVIMCSRILSIEHLVHTVNCFIATLGSYAIVVKKENPKLDLKGNAWVAACPSPNIAFPLDSSEYPDFQDLDTSEDIERRIDENPSKFDFLGKAIDTGFRIAKNSKPEQLTVSVQLAYLLCRASIASKFSFALDYGGRAELKGVNDGIPYPVLFINTETSPLKKRLGDRERALLGSAVPTPQSMFDFLQDFMEFAKIDHPYLRFRDEELKRDDLPESYKEFEQAYELALREMKSRDATYQAAEMSSDTSGDALPTADLEEMIDKSQETASGRRSKPESTTTDSSLAEKDAALIHPLE
jgi:hypothetical protein